ncbi:MAG: HIT family protein [Candidatus Tectomicrobia bacterium]|nr:HIT family protein [Candidatus Tectomicrobia bacterium]
MFDERSWAALVEGSGCPLCLEKDRFVVTTLPSGRVELVNDANFPGYCILVYHRHVVELQDLRTDERGQLIEDIACIARAIAERCQPAKINYEILGNTVPHLHCHIIPRYPNDGYWGGSIWLRPLDRRSEFPTNEYEALGLSLRALFTPEQGVKARSQTTV